MDGSVAEFTGLIIRCLKNEASTDEQVGVINWINASEEYRELYYTVRDTYIYSKLEEPVSMNRQKKSWDRINQYIKKPSFSDLESVSEQLIMPMQLFPRDAEKSEKTPDSSKRERPRDMFRVIPRQLSRMAAAVLFAFFLGTAATILYYDLISIGTYPDAMYMIEAPRGAKSTVTMADGSKVYLNAGSKISYNRDYNNHNRDIYLEGEGYFIVSHREHIPFKVHTSGITVQALGTEFNVKAYPEDGRVETTLIKGSVSIVRNGSKDINQGIVLTPNQRASVFLDRFEISEVAVQTPTDAVQQLTAISRPVRVKTETNINTESATSWKENRWVFERESMESLAGKLERQYDINITFRDEELRLYHLTGTLEEESIEQVLKALQIALPIDFQIRHKDVILSLNHKRKNNFKHLLK